MSGSGIRPRWRRLFGQGDKLATDFSVSPKHEIADDVTPVTSVPPPPTAEPLVTGITTEYPTSEIIYTIEGDLVVAVSG